MIQLINENKFEELQEALKNSNDYQIHKFLLEIINNKSVEIDGESFDARKYQEEYFEGLEIYKALQNSNIDKTQLKEYSNILVELAFKMCGFIQLMANSAMNKGVYLSDLEELYKVKPEVREKLQEFIDILKNIENEEKSVANISAAKAQVSNSIGNLLEKYEIGEDMIQFAESYENVGQKEMAIRIYQGLMNDFESNSLKLSSGLLPEISQVDDRPEKEIEIHEKAKKSFERLTGQNIQEPKRVHVNESIQAKSLEEKVENKVKEIHRNEQNGFLGKLKSIFKKN